MKALEINERIAPVAEKPATKIGRRPARWLRTVVLGAMVLLVAAAILRREWLASLVGRSTSSSAAATVVQLEPAARRDIAEFVQAGGKLQPSVLVKISPEVSGEIVDLPLAEGQSVRKGDVIVRIKPDFYTAAREAASAAYKAALANQKLADASVERATFEMDRVRNLFKASLVSESDYQAAKTGYDIALAQRDASGHQAEMARFALARAEEELAKTSVFSPLNGVVTKLSSQVGERVVGTATMAGTEIMQIADLNDMEARVEVGEVDVGLVQPGQSAVIDVDAARGRKFNGVVTYIANTPNNAVTAPGVKSLEATKFEVRIRVTDRYAFRPGMSATAVIQTRSKANVLAVPIQSVTTRVPKNAGSGEAPAGGSTKAAKPVEVVFVADADCVRMVPVVRGISDEAYVEILSGLTEGQRVVTGGYKAINRDLEDGTRIVVGEK